MDANGAISEANHSDTKSTAEKHSAGTWDSRTCSIFSRSFIANRLICWEKIKAQILMK
jgi:hypothetical protein